MEPQTNKDNSSTFPSIGQVFTNSWKTYKENFGKFIAVAVFILISYLVLFLITQYSDFILSIIGNQSENNIIYALQIFAVISYLVLIILYIIAIINWQTYSVIYIFKNRNNNPNAIEAVKYAIKKTGTAIWTNLIKSIIIFGGNLLLGIPGLILTINTVFSDISIVYNQTSGYQALSTSRYYANGKWWRILFFVFLLGVIYGTLYQIQDIANLILEKINIVSYVQTIIDYVFIFVFSVLLPFSIIVLGHIYEYLQLEKSPPSEEIIIKDRKKLIWYLVGSILSVIAIMVIFIGMIGLILSLYINNNPSKNLDTNTTEELSDDVKYPYGMTIDQELDKSIENINQSLNNYFQENNYFPYSNNISTAITDDFEIPYQCGTINQPAEFCGINYLWISPDKYQLEINYFSEIDQTVTSVPISK